MISLFKALANLYMIRSIIEELEAEGYVWFHDRGRHVYFKKDGLFWRLNKVTLSVDVKINYVWRYAYPFRFEADRIVMTLLDS